MGEVAARFDLETHVLRHWEDVGLLAPARDPAGRRRYVRDDVVRVAVVVRNKAAGMSLDQIRVLLDSDVRRPARRAAGAPGRPGATDGGDAAVPKEMTEHALRCRAHDVATCPRFRAHLDGLLEGLTRTR